MIDANTVSITNRDRFFIRILSAQSGRFKRQPFETMLVFNYGDFSAVYKFRPQLSTTGQGGKIALVCEGDGMGNVNSALGDRFIVLVGLMGVGKSSVGRKLAKKLDLPFIDADDEIEKAAGCSISEIFRLYGEPAFRDGERRVIARILSSGPGVLATGGGAFMDADTRAEIAERGVSIWLRADVEVLYERTRRRDVRPLLQTGDPRATLSRLAGERYPIYAQAELTIDTDTQKPNETVDHIIDELGGCATLSAS